jgi:outer membrane protein assembly factor BamE (lipoprotein component of BamABCDE complex)
MISKRTSVFASALLFCSTFTFAQAPASDPPANKPDPFQVNLPKQQAKKPLVLSTEKLTKEGKMEIIRGMTAELGYARKPFPFGKEGITIKDGKIIKPTDAQMQDIMTSYGAAIKPGDAAHITDIKFKDKALIFYINGGPVRKKKWYEHIQVGMGNSTVTPGQPTDNTNIHGSLVALEFDKYVPEVTAAQLKQLLDPIINFSAKSATEAYLDTIPPKAKQAITDHKALVGMNREMVTYALGRPPKKYRDKDANGNDYEEWIYGEPPQPVEFVRFEGDEVVRIETMNVDGTKNIRTAREITIQPNEPEVAQQTNAPQPAAQTQVQPASTDNGPAIRPTLRRPGEDQPDQAKPGALPPTVNIPDSTAGTGSHPPPQ